MTTMCSIRARPSPVRVAQPEKIAASSASAAANRVLVFNAILLRRNYRIVTAISTTLVDKAVDELWTSRGDARFQCACHRRAEELGKSSKLRLPGSAAKNYDGFAR